MSEAARFCDALIEACHFNEHDLDIGTSGLCGTFALALHDTLTLRGVSSMIVFLGPATAEGEPRFQRDQADYAYLIWRHALVKVDGTLFDIYGKAQPEHAIENYCWGDLPPHTSVFVPLTRDEATRVLEGTRHALCWDQHRIWSAQLEDGDEDRG